MKRSSSLILSCLFLVAVHITPQAAELPTVTIVATGGTIAMKVDPQTGGPVSSGYTLPRLMLQPS